MKLLLCGAQRGSISDMQKNIERGIIKLMKNLTFNNGDTIIELIDLKN